MAICAWLECLTSIPAACMPLGHLSLRAKAALARVPHPLQESRKCTSANAVMRLVS